MAYANSAGPFFVGTAIFIILGVFACFLARYCHQKGKNPEIGLSLVMITMTAVCCWMFWGMAWLMQWHPLIFPIKELNTVTS